VTSRILHRVVRSYAVAGPELGSEGKIMIGLKGMLVSRLENF
jgi:hypothetical protein